MMTSTPPQTVWILTGLVVAGLAAAIFHVYRIKKLDLAHPHLPVATPPPTINELVPDSKYVNIEGAELHFIQAGEGEDIVLLHGIGASVFIWRFLFPILQARHRVTAFDIAGFGKSCKEPDRNYGLDAQSDLIAKALTAIGIDKAHLVGSSMGGAIALWMAKRWPERFENIVALGPATDSSLVPSITQYLAAATPIFRYTVNRRTIRLVLNFVVNKRELITEQVIDRYLEPFQDRGQGLRAFVAATSILSDRRLPKALKDLKSRVLIIWGANDFMVPRRSIAKLRSVLPKAQFIEHESGGHHIMEDEPVYIARQLELFLAGNENLSETKA